MTQNRRLILRAAAGAAAASALAPMAWAQSGQPIKILVGFPPGGGSDAIARLLADKLKDELGGVTVLVTGEVRARVEDLAILELDRVQVVGRSEAVGLHALLGDAQMAASADFTAYREQHQQMIALYQQGQFAQARQALEPLMAQPWPGLGSFYTVLSQRLLELQQLPAGQWQGVHVASSK